MFYHDTYMQVKGKHVSHNLFLYFDVLQCVQGKYCINFYVAKCKILLLFKTCCSYEQKIILEIIKGKIQKNTS